jgi:RNA polymerase sigma factor (sigma-70 family)
MSERPSYKDACEQHIWEIYGFLAYRTGSRADAEDLTQETFERAFKAWGRYDPTRASVRTWLTAIARNLLIDHYRSSRSAHERPLDDDPGLEAPPEALDLGLDPNLANALATLGDRDRQIIALRYGADLSGPEIAEITNLSLANVQQILSRSLRRLRSELDGARVTVPEALAAPARPRR